MVRNDFLMTAVFATAITMGVVSLLTYGDRTAVQVGIAPHEKAAADVRSAPATGDKAFDAVIVPAADKKLRRAGNILLEDVSVMAGNSI